MKFKKYFCLLSVVLCLAFISAAFSGCFSLKANIESLEIDVSGFDDHNGEITVYADNMQSLNLGVRINWQENTDRNKKLDVTWGFIGDDLGCEFKIIDPCCTNGTLGDLILCDKTGKVVLRATAKSKNEVSKDLIIWIESL